VVASPQRVLVRSRPEAAHRHAIVAGIARWILEDARRRGREISTDEALRRARTFCDTGELPR
jgi:hypothetical protein